MFCVTVWQFAGFAAPVTTWFHVFGHIVTPF